MLRSPDSIRARCREILALGREARLGQFRLHEERLETAAAYVAENIRANYPDLDIPMHSRWRHFATPKFDRWRRLSDRLSSSSREERSRIRFDLAVTSVLLDAGAGPAWRYRDPRTGETHGRSEGLALASFDLFESGGFSSRSDDPWRADADRLETIASDDLATAFQVFDDNPLVGLEGRASLLRGLAGALRANPAHFGRDDVRIGHLHDYLVDQSSGGELSIRVVLQAVLEGFSTIWPGRIEIHGRNLGDVWHHPGILRDDETRGLVPFHKLSQWLTYSLVEPLAEAGLTITELDAMTGLAEYRNGGLFIDLGVLEPLDPDFPDRTFTVDSELVVEWRALTIACLDELLPLVRNELGRDDRSLTLTQMLEGGTWNAGRRLAKQRREDGGPPIRVASDGTVF